MNFQPEMRPAIYVLVQQNDAGVASQPNIKRKFGADISGVAKVYPSHANPYQHKII
jgi:hypothetical protein